MVFRLVFLLIFFFSVVHIHGQPIRLLKQGCIKQNDFIEEVSVQNYLDLLLVNVGIGGQDYTFMFDTGADISVISKDIISDLNLQPEKHCTIEDSKNRKHRTELLALPEIVIGNISFHSTAAAVEDLEPLNTILSCIEIDGIIGNNLIRLASWQIDYSQSILRITDRPEKLTVADNAIKVPLHMGTLGSAKIDVEYNGIKDRLTFDTGSNGDISTSMKVFGKLMHADKDFQFAKASGDQSGGLYGSRQGDTWHGYISELYLNEYHAKNRIVKFEKDAAKTIGNRFFKSFVVTMDLESSLLYLEQVKPMTCEPITTYGFEFKPDYSSNGFRIGVVWEELNTNFNFPKLGSRVVRINDVDLTQLSKDDFCQYLKEDINQKFTGQINLVINEDGIERTVTVDKTQILPQ